MKERNEEHAPHAGSGQHHELGAGVNEGSDERAESRPGRPQACADSLQEGDDMMVPCAREETTKPARLRRPMVRQLRSPDDVDDCQLRLVVRVPADVKAALDRAGQEPTDEINRVVEALWSKLKHETGPAPSLTATYASEVLAFERLIKSRPEVLTIPEQVFVILNRAHQEVSDIEDVLEPEDVSPYLIQVAVSLAEGVFEAQAEVRKGWNLTDEENDAKEIA